MNKKEIALEIENLRFHRDMLSVMLDEAVDPILKMELKAELRMCLKRIRTLNDLLLDIYATEIKLTYPQADAVYEDRIVEIIGNHNLCHMVAKGKIQLCGCINGRRLYAL